MTGKRRTAILKDKPIVIVDYGMGNLGSIKNMLLRIGSKGVISSDIADIERASKLILAGVGAFDNAMKNVFALDLAPVLNSKVIEDKTPILGICLGMQVMANKSEEGKLPGLGWIDAEVKRFRFGEENRHLKIPHMGWNLIKVRKYMQLLNGLGNESRFYFVHSYHMVCRNVRDKMTTTFYGYDFVSSVLQGNIAGVQFHPEKSHKFGMQLMKNFAEFE